MGTVRPKELTFLVQGTGVTKLCFYIFPDNSSQPRWVARIARSPRDNKIIDHEYELIGFIREGGSSYVLETVPGPLLTTEITGHSVGIEPFHRGQSMDGLIAQNADHARRDVREYIDLAVEWLLRCQKDVPGNQGKLKLDQIETYLLGPIKHLRLQSDLTDVEEAYLDRLEQQINSLSNIPLPLAFTHGDFRPGNILLDDGDIHVLDWEFGARLAPPLLDIFHFLSRTYARYHGLEEIDGYLEDYLTAFEQLFFENGEWAHLAAEIVDNAADALGVDHQWIRPLFALFLVEEANKLRRFLSQRSEIGYPYLLRSREYQIPKSYRDRLARQKYVWLLGHLAANEKQLAISHIATDLNTQIESSEQEAVWAA